jgi:hypothetical protein
MLHDPDSSFPVSECESIEGFCFMVILKFQNANLYVAAPEKYRFQATLAIFETPECSNITVYLT